MIAQGIILIAMPLQYIAGFVLMYSQNTRCLAYSP